jgi:hypothetical protein
MGFRQEALAARGLEPFPAETLGIAEFGTLMATKKAAAKRLLYIHAGGGKAGSSAIQAALAAEGVALNQIGIGYLEAPPQSSAFAITSGNGFKLYQALVSENDTPIEVLLDGLMGDFEVAICSSEFLGALSPVQWGWLRACASSKNIELRLIYFASTASHYLVSSYNQEVKRHGESRDIFDYVKTAAWRHYDDLVNASEAFSRTEISVLSYEQSKSAILTAFSKSWPDLELCQGILSPYDDRIVNRSLTSSELDIVRMINVRWGDRFSQQISDVLIYSKPEAHPKEAPDPELIRTIEKKFSSATAWINATFFENEDGLKAFQAKDFGKRAATRSDGNSSESLVCVLEWALGQIAANDERSDGYRIAQSLAAIDWENSGHADIPADFDPVAYLLLHKDVASTGVPPYDHYLKSGKLEGRAHRWPETVSPLLDAGGSANHHSSVHTGDCAPTSNLAQLKVQHQYQMRSLLAEAARRERRLTDDLRDQFERAAYTRAELSLAHADLNSAVRNEVKQISSLWEGEFVKQIDLIHKLRQQISDHLLCTENNFHSFVDNLNNYAVNSTDTVNKEINHLVDVVKQDITEMQMLLHGRIESLQSELRFLVSTDTPKRLQEQISVAVSASEERLHAAIQRIVSENALQVSVVEGNVLKCIEQQSRTYQIQADNIHSSLASIHRTAEESKIHLTTAINETVPSATKSVTEKIDRLEGVTVMHTERQMIATQEFSELLANTSTALSDLINAQTGKFAKVSTDILSVESRIEEKIDAAMDQYSVSLGQRLKLSAMSWALMLDRQNTEINHLTGALLRYRRASMFQSLVWAFRPDRRP